MQDINESYDERVCVSTYEITEEEANTISDITDNCNLKDVTREWQELFQS